MRILNFSSLEEYRAVQVQANKLKFRNVFADERELRRIADHFASNGLKEGVGLCHGVRNGYEVKLLRTLLPTIDITGTDISDTAASIPNCIVWDMHEIKPEWRGSIDFLYSNSWDHSYDPVKLFANWSACLSERGVMYVAYTDSHTAEGVTEDTKVDSFGCSLDELLGILQRTLVLDDLLEVRPRFNGRVVGKRLSYLRAGRFDKFFGEPLSSRRIVVLALRRRLAAMPN